MKPSTVLITGAAGNLGGKLRRHLEGRYDLRLLDRDPRGDATIEAADLSRWDDVWTRRFEGVDAVVHLAADPVAFRSWGELLAPNVDALIHVYEAAARARVRRFVFASSNHVMGGYQNRPEPRLTPDLPPLPGTHYIADGEARDSTAYGAAKLFGERLGKCYADSRGLSVIAVRIGWVLRGENRPQDLPTERGPWFRQMWLSNRDFCRLMECALTADLATPFAVVNGMSGNTGMRWDLTATRELLGYEPLDDVTRSE
jgi:uronate dehydrogenase